MGYGSGPVGRPGSKPAKTMGFPFFPWLFILPWLFLFPWFFFPILGVEQQEMEKE